MPLLKSWQRIEVSGIPIDLIPFGGIEEPPNAVSVANDHILNVAGFREVFDKAASFSLNDALSIKLPSVPGFAALKLHSWFDRQQIGKYKDASDLGLILSWYEEDYENLWDRYLNSRTEKYLGEPELMAAELLGIDVGEVLGSVESHSLIKRFEKQSDIAIELFGSELFALGEHKHPLNRRVLQVQALLEGLRFSMSKRR